MNSRTSGKNFLKGAAILGVAGLIVKVIGAIYRIPLTNILTPQGMDIYGVAYPAYSLLLTISSAGLPTAISKLVAERSTLGDRQGAYNVFRAAYRFLAIMGAIITIIMMAGSGIIANLLKSPDAALSMISIAPAILFVCLISAYRGYFQGHHNMVPTAASQITEQLGKVVLGFVVFIPWLLPLGLPYGAAGALMGVTGSELAALVILMGMHARTKRALKVEGLDLHSQMTNMKPIIKALLVIGVPITIGASIMPLVQFLDTAIVKRVLIDVLGYSTDAAKEMFGILTGNVNSLVNMPSVLTLALAMGLIPAITAHLAKRDMRGVSAISSIGLKLAILIGLPCSVGLAVLSQPILQLLYPSLSAGQLTLAASLLEVMAVATLFLAIVQGMTGVLQGQGKVYLPVIALAIGAVVKIIFSLMMIRNPNYNIMGAPIGTVACYAFAACLDIVFAMHYCKLRFSLKTLVVKPVIASAFMGLAAYFSYGLMTKALMQALKKAEITSLINALSVAAAIVVAIIIYALFLIVLGAIRPEDMEFIPGGGKLGRVMYRFGIWKRGDRIS